MPVTVPKPGTRGVPFPKFPGRLARFFGRQQKEMPALRLRAVPQDDAPGSRVA